MSSKYKFRNQEKLYFVTFAVVYWLDVFIRKEYKEAILESLEFCQLNKGLEIYGWCIMTSHIHLIIGSNGGKMEDILRDFKSFTSRNLKELIKSHPQESRREWLIWMMERAGKKNNHNKGFKYWQEGSHPIELSDNQMMEQKLNYIHENPIVSGFVDRAEDYLYSSARDYTGGKGLLKIKFIE
jgi:putative transposase